MNSEIIARSELPALLRSPAAVERERRAALERTYAEAGDRLLPDVVRRDCGSALVDREPRPAVRAPAADGHR